MSFYESVFILRQDLTTDNAKALCKKFSKVLEDDEGKVAKTEYWGLRNLTYKINKNKKGHYFLINSKSSGPAILKMEKLLNIDENILRYLTIKISKIEEEASIMMKEDKRSDRETRDRRNKTTAAKTEEKEAPDKKEEKKETIKDREKKDIKAD